MAKRLKKLARKPPKTMIGWREWCALPDLGLPAIRVKIDTGARTSALHAYDIETFKKGSKKFVCFKVHPLDKNTKRVQICTAQLIGNRVVVSSNGRKEIRPVIATHIKVGESRFFTELTLTGRHEMNFRMLLGRKALRAGRFTVNPGKSFLMGKIEKPETLYKKK
jgi:hypothetical protein